MTLVLKLSLGFVVLISLVAFIVCGYDKYMAKTGGWRIPEATLLLFSLFGGGLGMSLGIHLFRHKTRHPLVYIPAYYGAVLSVLIVSGIFYIGW